MAVDRSGAWLVGAAAIVAVTVETGAAQEARKSAADNYDAQYQYYLQAARQMPSADASIEWMTGLSADRRARGLNDILTVRVVESAVASGSADAQLAKDNSTSGSMSNFFGLESVLPSAIDPTNLVNTESSTKFKGGGATTRSGSLMATMTARVVEVLPNGDLVLEGVREIDVNGDRQIIVLTGTVRAADVRRDNTVISTQLGQLRIRYFGKGLIRDNLRPGWLVRVFNKIF